MSAPVNSQGNDSDVQPHSECTVTSRNKNTKRFIWQHDLPAWFAAIGTVALALIAILTLAPVIENLELQERNVELEESIRQHTADLDSTRAEHTKIKKELEELNHSNAIAKRNLEKLQQNSNTLFDLLSTLADNTKEQRARLKEYDERMRDMDAKLKELEQERAEVERKLKDTEDELNRNKQEYEEALIYSRHFILMQITTKVKEEIREVSIDDIEEFIDDYSIEKKGILSNIKKGLSKFAFYIRNKELALASYGKTHVLSQFDSQVFNLLPEKNRIEFKDEIRDYISNEKDIFSKALKVGKEPFDNYMNACLLLKNEEAALTEKELSMRESKYEEAKTAFYHAIAQFNDDRQSLFDALDEMAKHLSKK
ncbi:hypothetical protein ACFL60_05835 [Candidatus Omnitrophota bacterium]